VSFFCGLLATFFFSLPDLFSHSVSKGKSDKCVFDPPIPLALDNQMSSIQNVVNIVQISLSE
jgi:hypothetical protein